MSWTVPAQPVACSGAQSDNLCSGNLLSTTGQTCPSTRTYLSAPGIVFPSHPSPPLSLCLSHPGSVLQHFFISVTGDVLAQRTLSLSGGAHQKRALGHRL